MKINYEYKTKVYAEKKKEKKEDFFIFYCCGRIKRYV